MLTPPPLALLVLGSIALAPFASAQTPQTFTPKAIVQFAPGGDRERAVLSRMPGLAELIKGQFGLGAADLNGVAGKRDHHDLVLAVAV